MIIFFIGYMGCGKSYVVNKLTNDIKDAKIIDMDSEIEKLEGKSITEIFETKGEKYFRKKETKFIESLIGTKPHELILVATGGGAPIKNIDLMNEIGTTIYIKLSPEEIYNNLKNDDLNKRPLLKNLSDEDLMNKIKNDLKKREKYYKKAKYIYDEIKNSNFKWT